MDLACGKGAVSIAIAKVFGCKVKGIDLIHDFINVACEKAKDENVAEHCAFEVGDINQSVLVEKDYECDALENEIDGVTMLLRKK